MKKEEENIKKEIESPIITLSAVGDVSLCDGVEKKILENGADFPFAKIKHIFSDADISFANIENIFSNCDDGRSSQAHLLKCQPEAFQAIVDASFSVVSLANNHILDYGDLGLKDTIDILDLHHILHCGAGSNLSKARKPGIINKRGITFGFLSYAMKGVQSASTNSGGAAWIDSEHIFRDMEALRFYVDHIIISLHSGLEFIDYPHPDHRNLCLEIANRSASLIIGHHPHVIHGIEMVKNCLIAYSLGNLIFDTMLMDYKTERSRQGLALRCRFTKDRIIDYDVIPTIISLDLQPKIADNMKRGMIIKRFKKISDDLSSKDYPKVYFRQASELWPKINIAVNLNIIKTQGLIAFMKRLPRIKKIYLLLLFRYVFRKAKNFFL